jgi:hypothetical protein
MKVSVRPVVVSELSPGKFTSLAQASSSCVFMDLPNSIFSFHVSASHDSIYLINNTGVWPRGS